MKQSNLCIKILLKPSISVTFETNFLFIYQFSYLKNEMDEIK